MIVDGDLGDYFDLEPATGALFLTQHLQPGAYQFNVKAEVFQPVYLVARVPVKVKIGRSKPTDFVHFPQYIVTKSTA